MRKILILLAALTATAPAQAQSRDVQAYCSSIGQFARTVMENRQAGQTMAAMMAVKAPSADFQQLGETLIAAAFREPVGETEEQKQRAVNAFERSTTAACTDAGSSQ